jgi:putative PEP-CTERM system histidine kinase
VKRILDVMWVDEAAVYTTHKVRNRFGVLHRVGFDDLPEEITFPAEFAGPKPDSSEHAGQKTGEGPFPASRVGHVVPLTALDTRVGLLIVGRERSCKEFTADDRLLVEAMAAQTATSLLNARLAQEASEGRDMQVFSRLSSFVTHDLKNMVTMLSGLADNARRYMSDPEFQADAIRTMGDVTGRMQALLTTLASPSTNGHVKTGTIPLSASVRTFTEELHGQLPPRIRLETRLNTLAHVQADPDHLRSVLRNLVLNAAEAIPASGTIVVETGQDDGQAVLTVTDDGKGMSREFMQQRLFRPFQTTKARGLGIGLYQSRHIVESYRGTLTANSEEGKGTRMRVSLPIVEELPAGSGQAAAGREETAR